MNDRHPAANIVFTRSKLRTLKKMYNECNTETFMFEGNELLKSYAKYLIQYLEMKFRYQMGPTD